MSVPKELRYLLDYLHQKGLEQPQLFVDTGNNEEIQTLVDYLDTGRDLEEYQGSVQSVGGCLIFFLQSLQQPVVDSSIVEKCVGLSSAEECGKYLLGATTVHYSVFMYLMAFLREEVLLQSAKNGLTAERLGESLRSPLCAFADCLHSLHIRTSTPSYFTPEY